MNAKFGLEVGGPGSPPATRFRSECHGRVYARVWGCALLIVELPHIDAFTSCSGRFWVSAVVAWEWRNMNIVPLPQRKVTCTTVTQNQMMA